MSAVVAVPRSSAAQRGVARVADVPARHAGGGVSLSP